MTVLVSAVPTEHRGTHIPGNFTAFGIECIVRLLTLRFGGEGDFKLLMITFGGPSCFHFKPESLGRLLITAHLVIFSVTH